jgi:hypothetical protein
MFALFYYYFNNFDNPYYTVLGLDYEKGFYIKYVMFSLNIFFDIFICLYMFIESFKIGGQNLFLRGTIKKWIIAKIIIIILYIVVSKVLLYSAVILIFNFAFFNNPLLAYFLKNVLVSLSIMLTYLSFLIVFEKFSTSAIFLVIITCILSIFPITIIKLKISNFILGGILLILIVFVVMIFRKKYFNIYEKL